MTAEERLEALALERGAEWGIRCEAESECAWSAEVRWTADPNRRGKPDRSLVTFSAGGLSAEAAAARAVDDLLDWLGAPS